jgi:histone-lysine N-methyltransferase SETMAR
MSELEQRAGIKFLWKERCPAKEIHERLQAVDGDAAYAPPSVYYSVKEFRCGRDDIVDQTRPGRSPIDNLDGDILCVLQYGPFATVRSIAEEVDISHETVHRRLTESLGLRPRLLEWVPHFLTPNLKRKRVELAKELLDILRFEEHTGFHRILTGDESWLSLDYSSDHISACADDNVPQRVSRQIRSEKVMLAVFRSTRGPILMKWMERVQRFNTTYCINEIIHDLVANLRPTDTFPDKKWYRLHLDNARPHISQDSAEYIERHRLVRVPHPPDSPNLAPSDFYLFGYMKGRRAKRYGTTKEDLFRNVTEILNSISEEELVRVFLDWMGD